MLDFFTKPMFTEFFMLLVTLLFSALGWVVHENYLHEEIKILNEENRQLKDKD